VLRIVNVAVPLTSLKLGVSKVHAAPNSIVLLALLQVMTGAVVSLTVTF
jgi:hypothetical protein